MFERCTERARRAVVLAHDEGEGVAAASLESLGVSSESVRDAVRELIGRGDNPPTERLA